MLFGNYDHFRQVLKDFIVQEDFKLVRYKNERTRMTCPCAAEGCKWRIYISPLPNGMDHFQDQDLDEHTYVKIFRNVEANSTWVAQKLSR